MSGRNFIDNVILRRSCDLTRKIVCARTEISGNGSNIARFFMSSKNSWNCKCENARELKSAETEVKLRGLFLCQQKLVKLQEWKHLNHSSKPNQIVNIGIRFLETPKELLLRKYVEPSIQFYLASDFNSGTGSKDLSTLSSRNHHLSTKKNQPISKMPRFRPLLPSFSIALLLDAPYQGWAERHSSLLPIMPIGSRMVRLPWT